jgi:hypothetical protein
VTNSAITAPACNTTVQAQVAVANGPMQVTVHFLLDGTGPDNPVTQTLPDGGGPVTFGPVDAVAHSSVTVSVDGLAGQQAANWTAPAQCLSSPSPTPDPTGSPAPTLS